MWPTKAGDIPQPHNSYVNVPTTDGTRRRFHRHGSPELIGAVNAAKTGVTPNTIFNPFAESGPNSAVPFRCDPSGNPMPLLTPGLSFGQAGIRNPGRRRNALQQDSRPRSSIPKLANVITAYTASAIARTASSRPTSPLRSTTAWISATAVNNANNFDFRVDHHFSDKNIVFGRAYMMWDTNNGIVAGTTSITPSPFHTWNIGGAWDHIFTPNLILEMRGGVNARPVMVNPTNPHGFTPETAGRLLEPRRHRRLLPERRRLHRLGQ